MRWHDAPQVAALAEGEERSGAARVELPAGVPGARVELVARMRLAEHEDEWIERVETLSWGELEQRIDQGVLEEQDGQTVLAIQGEWRAR